MIQCRVNQNDNNHIHFVIDHKTQKNSRSLTIFLVDLHKMLPQQHKSKCTYINKIEL